MADFSGASWRLEGLKELEQQLVALGDTFGEKAVQKRVVGAAMKSAMIRVAGDMQKAAPQQPAPRKSLLPIPLKYSVGESFRQPNARDKRSNKITPGMFAIYVVGVKSSKKLLAQEFGRYNVDDSRYEGQPFIRKTFERNLSVVQSRITDELRGAMILFQRTEKNKALRALKKSLKN